jgi:DNA-binding NarL/FixJ family response regulator
MSKEKISLVIVDDHELTRLGIRKIIEQADDFEIVGEASNGDDAIALVEQQRPKVLLLDIQMPGKSASEIERWVRKRYPEVITLILTGHDRDRYLAEFMKLGVAGYLDKKIEAYSLIAAIRRAVRGENLFTPEQFKRASKWNTTVGNKWESLSPREKQVGTLLARGLNNQTIADNLGITYRTVSFHIESILIKLEVETRQHAIAWINKNVLGNL